MSAIRPDLPAVQPRNTSVTEGSSSVRQAQAAFFRAALGEVQATQVQATPVRTTPIQPQTAEPAPSAGGRSLRPGSLLDIKV
jgi:hypothetical protein